MAKGTQGYKVRTIACERCGVTVTKRMPAGRRFCTLSCYRSSSRPDRRTGERRSCERCGEAFYVTRSRVDQGEGQFCSLACHNLNQGSGKTDHVCKMCGEGFRWSPSRTASGNYRVTYCSLACRDADPERLAQLLAMNERLQLRRTTKAEVLGYALLDALTVDYDRQRSFAGKFTPDAVVPASRLVVQFDGDYWHDRAGNSTESRIVRRVALDISQDAYVRACGWDVVRLWESDLRSDPEGCRGRVSQFLHRPLGDAPGHDPLARA